MENRINKEILDCQAKKDLISKKYDLEYDNLEEKQENLLNEYIREMGKLGTQRDINISIIRESYKDNQ